MKILSKEELKHTFGDKLPGGGATVGSNCSMTITFPNGSTETTNGYFTGDTYSDVSKAAGIECAKAMNEMGESRCVYDCTYDGIG